MTISEDVIDLLLLLDEATEVQLGIRVNSFYSISEGTMVSKLISKEQENMSS